MEGPARPPIVPTKTEAFFGGGCGCLALIGGLAGIALVFGGQVRADVLGVALFFVLCGCGGLVWRWSVRHYCRKVANRAYRDGVEAGYAQAVRERENG